MGMFGINKGRQLFCKYGRSDVDAIHLSVWCNAPTSREERYESKRFWHRQHHACRRVHRSSYHIIYIDDHGGLRTVNTIIKNYLCCYFPFFGSLCFINLTCVCVVVVHLYHNNGEPSSEWISKKANRQVAAVFIILVIVALLTTMPHRSCCLTIVG